MSVINNTTYFLGPLYTNNIFSISNKITIINDVKWVGIITKDISCNNILCNNISFAGNINIISNSLSLNVPITYISNVSLLTDISYADLGINRNNNISNTLGYTFNVRNEASTNTDAYFPFLGAYTTLPNNYSIISTSNLTIGSINVPTPGMYLLYVQMQLFLGGANNTTTYSLFNFNTEVQIGTTTILQNNEMCDIQNYRPSTEYANAHYFYNKVIMCNVTSANSNVTLIYKPLVANIHYAEVNLGVDTVYNHGRTLRYNIIKIS
jgi:hypothetical protein